LQTDQPERTAPWIWPKRSDDTLLAFTDAHLASVRSCLFAWNLTEHGAAALALFEDYRIPEGDDEMSRVVDLFLNKARLDGYSGIIRNRFADPTIKDTDASILLDGMPDAATEALIMSRADIPFEASAEELALWAVAYRSHGGLDPKRPFGSESVARDVRRIVDPKRKMTNAAFAKYRKQVESRLALLLVYFVQNAELAAGEYVWRDSSWFSKAELPPDEEEAPEMLHAEDWSYRVAGEFWSLNFPYLKTLAPLHDLICEDRISGTYGEIVERYRLWDHYDAPNTHRYACRLLDLARAALRHFPETSGNAEKSVVTLVAARVLNSTARFEEAALLLQQAKLSPQTGTKIEIETISYATVAVLERLVADFGLGRVARKDVGAVLAGGHKSYPEIGYMFYALVDRLGKVEPGINDIPVSVYAHVRAAAWQLKIMRRLAGA
jgi:hypothetical protein